MPRSKRDRKVTLAKTGQKVNRDAKAKHIQDIRDCVEKYGHVYVLESENMRNVHMQDLRVRLKGSKFVFGRKKMCQLALGRDASSECADGISAVSKHLVGQNCLLFTTMPTKEVVTFFNNFEELTYARSGFLATESVDIPAGPMEEFVPAQEPFLRQLGLPTKLEKGVVVLQGEYKVCDAGDKLTPEKAKILEQKGIAMAAFRFKPICHWGKGEGFSLL